MNGIEIDWEFEKRRFEQVAFPFALRAAKRAFKKWPERKRADAEAGSWPKCGISGRGSS
jgi:hypothetical protein